jgi:hypothetical protein
MPRGGRPARTTGPIRANNTWTPATALPASIGRVGWRIRIISCLIVAGLALGVTEPALAQGGTTTSAGDQQYTDPLGNTNTAATPPPATSTPAPSSTTSAPSSSSSASAPSSPSQPAATSPTAASTPTADPAKTLPFTGLNVGLVVAVGLGLLGGGFLLRGLTRRA